MASFETGSAGAPRNTMGLPDMRRSGRRNTEAEQAPAGAGDAKNRRGLGNKALLLVLFAVVLNLLQVIATVLAVAQFLFAWLGGGANPQLRGFGDALGGYIAQVVRYLTFVSDDLPFPFSPWPERGDAGGKSRRSG